MIVNSKGVQNSDERLYIEFSTPLLTLNVRPLSTQLTMNPNG